MIKQFQILVMEFSIPGERRLRNLKSSSTGVEKKVEKLSVGKSILEKALSIL